MNQTQIDLRQLAWNRDPSPAQGRDGKSSRWFSRYVVPLVLLFGFLALFSFSAGSHLLSRRSVTVVPVVVQRGSAAVADTPLFQTAGWVEPRPTAVSIPALAAGVIEQLLVVEGQHVRKGEPIARLISIDAQLTVKQVETTVAIRKGELQRVEAELAAALTRLERPVHLRSQLAEAENFLAKGETEWSQLPFLLQASKAQLEFETNNLERKRIAGDAIAGIALAKAQRDYESSVARHNELLQREKRLKREVETLQTRVTALRDQLEFLVDEKLQVSEATARIASATALLAQAEVELEQAKLNLDRTVIRAPMDGRILRVIASPGTRVMGGGIMGVSENTGQATGGQESQGRGAIAQLYDPKKLQVRADVRLEDVPLVKLGASVEIRTASSQKAIKGRVLQQTSSANIQKNTLEVKVELLDPPLTVSPEMLVTATFMAPPSDTLNQEDQVTQVQEILIPRQLVQSRDESNYVWRVDADSRAQLRPVTLGASGRDGLVVVSNGLNPTDKVIVPGDSPLIEGQLVTILSEDANIGIN